MTGWCAGARVEKAEEQREGIYKKVEVVRRLKKRRKSYRRMGKTALGLGSVQLMLKRTMTGTRVRLTEVTCRF